jgi:predicted nucleic acid-binding protein
MTTDNPAKQAAKEIVDMFYECLSHIAIGTNGIEHLILERAKACGILHQQSIIKMLEEITDEHYVFSFYDRLLKEREILNEIQKL